MTTELDATLRKKLLEYQRNEITEYHIYRNLAEAAPLPENRQVLERIAADEKHHYQMWANYTGQEVAPDWKQVRKYTWISRVLGLTFGLKLMERGELNAQAHYAELQGVLPEVEAFIEEENRHEHEVLALLNEERLEYAGSVVLGLNDALVELTGALAGFTLALQNARLIAITGLITGIAAALSMAASEYLSTKAEFGDKDPLRASFYTGTAYLITVLTLILPYLLLSNYYLSLGITLLLAVLVIAAFNYYIAVAKDRDFKQQFLEMVAISLSVAVFSFLIGFVLRTIFGVDV